MAELGIELFAEFRIAGHEVDGAFQRRPRRDWPVQHHLVAED